MPTQNTEFCISLGLDIFTTKWSYVILKSSIQFSMKFCVRKVPEAQTSELLLYTVGTC